MTSQTWMALGGVAVFALVWAGLARNIVKIARRGKHPPSFHPFLGAAHLGRFAGWALVGAATLHADVVTGALLLVTRVPAVGLIAVTFLQRSECRPSGRRLLRWLAPSVGGLVALCAAVAILQPTLVPMAIGGGGGVLPPATWLQYLLNAIVALCFAVQLAYGLPRQIADAVHKPLGNLRWFQLALLINYAYAFVYASFVVDPLVGMVMSLAYGVALAEQAVLVVLIERGVRRLRRGEFAETDARDLIGTEGDEPALAPTDAA